MTESELREQLAASDRAAAEIRQLSADTFKLMLERMKLEAAGQVAPPFRPPPRDRRLDRRGLIEGLVAVLGIVGWVVTIVGVGLLWKTASL